MYISEQKDRVDELKSGTGAKETGPECGPGFSMRKTYTPSSFPVPAGDR